MTAKISELIVEANEGVTTLRLNRPQRRHALSLSLLQELEESLQKIAQDHSVRVVVIASDGPVFSSGHDLGEMQGCSEEEYQKLFSTCARVMQLVRNLPQPVIARVQGFATAAGCQLVAACDLAVASDQAQFATPGVKIGLFCTTPMVPLVRNVAPKIAMEMLLTGKPISAEKALAAGLVNAVVPVDQLDDAVKEYTSAIVASSRQTLAIGKQEFYAQLNMDESHAYDQAVNVMTKNVLQHDAQEGMSAFLEKRTPQWEE
ncbi:enoyl-CoA hydratase [Thalassoglobus polymorphus]|uniref:Enoyl-CoA hydratase domain-containing protein 3, mitochondrial n=1 Tax=Thalassoglobus polymorphus TaxID=2527994 RepID=A0A517QJT5_9PLAN|nr:enoyl-CoA hydratase [Thalassoglobus polymorphus]QDT31864.1 2,3-dehydroadipyl-CoA hydratase [Thalassoglobus polymorphus]